MRLNIFGRCNYFIVLLVSALSVSSVFIKRVQDIGRGVNVAWTDVAGPEVGRQALSCYLF